MVSSTLSLATAVGLLAIQPATAGFVIYLGKSNDVVPGEGTGGGGVNSSISKALFYNQKPKEGCDGTAQEMTINGYGDVTMGRGGWVCDGCGVADNTDDDGNDYPDRFEVNDEDGDVFEGGGHISKSFTAQSLNHY